MGNFNKELAQKDYAQEGEIHSNRKDVLRFTLVMVLCGLVGGVIGFFSAMFAKRGLHLDTVYQQLGDFFNTVLVPAARILAPVFAVIYFGVQIVHYYYCRKMMKMADLEDEQEFEKMDHKLSFGLCLSSFGMLFMLLLGGISSYNLDKTLKSSGILYLVAIGCYLAVIIAVIYFQNKLVNMAKKLYPEKKASVFEKKFQKKWFDSCDEAEKYMIYKASYQEYRIMNSYVYPFAAIGLFVIGTLFEIGLFSFIIVMILWMISNISYLIEASKFSH